MDYKMAYEYCIKYAESEGIDYKKRLKVKTETRFRFDFNSIDLAFNKSDSTLIVRACIASQSNKREDFLAIMDELSIKYKKELAGGKLEFDETALEVDGYEPNRLNIRLDFKTNEMDNNEFNKKVDDLLTAALRWRNKYYMSIYEELNKTWKKN